MKMNRWQKIYCDTYYDGKTPRNKKNKAVFEMLGKISDNGSVTVHYPAFKDISGKVIPAHVETFKVTEDGCDMPNGMISVEVLASNLELWVLFRGQEVEFR